MGFIKKVTDLDLGITTIENIFISDYMPFSDGTYVKVYLMGYKLSQDDNGKNFSNEQLSNHLNIPVSDVHKAWDYWLDQGIIEKLEKESGYDIAFLSLRQLYIDNIYKVKTKQDVQVPQADDFLDINRNPMVKDMFFAIDQVMRRPLAPNEKRKVISWMKDYSFDEEMIRRTFEYAVEVRQVKSLNYVSTLIRNWYDQGLVTVEKIENYLEVNNKRYVNYIKIYRSMGYGNRQVTSGDKESIDNWLDKLKLEMEFILYVVKESSKKTNNLNMNYMNAIFERLYKDKILTIEDYNNQTSPKMIPEKKSYQSSQKNKFHNFDQASKKYTNDELDDILSNKKKV